MVCIAVQIFYYSIIINDCTFCIRNAFDLIHIVIYCLMLIVKERTVAFSLFSGSYTYPINIDHPQHDYSNG